MQAESNASSQPVHKRHTELKVRLIGSLGALTLKLLNRTLRWQTVGTGGENAGWQQGQPRILVFWHAHQLFMPWLYLNGRTSAARAMVALISAHEDGRMVADAMKRLGIDSIEGSSSRGGKKALFDLIQTVKDGSHIAITPDGPKGPARKLRDGVIRIAQRSRARIYPAAIGCERKWVFASWDRMFLPKPFSRAVLMMGKPIEIPEKLTAEELARYAALVEDALNALTDAAEQFQYGGSAAAVAATNPSANCLAVNGDE